MYEDFYTPKEFMNLIKKAMDNNDPLAALAAKGFVASFIATNIPSWLSALANSNPELPLDANEVSKEDYDADMKGLLQLIERLAIDPDDGCEHRCLFCGEPVTAHAPDCPWVAARELLQTSE